MDKRTHEGHMDWSYEGSGPVDHQSPWAQLARKGQENQNRGIFSTPSKITGSETNSFSKLGASNTSPFKPQPPQTSIFTPRLSPHKAAAPLRNPAFTTPRRPFDEQVQSEASGAEDSPSAFTDTSDNLNDTPEIDYQGDTNMFSAMTPSKVSKSHRYGKHGASSRRPVAGRGEIRAHRDYGTELLRKRKRHNYDTDVGSVALHMNEDHSEYHDPFSEQGRYASKNGAGIVESTFSFMERFKNAPTDIWNWSVLAFRLGLMCTAILSLRMIWNAATSDLMDVLDADYQEILRQVAQCTKQYQENQCSTGDLVPALRPLCSEWFECMGQNTDSRKRITAAVKAAVDLLNEVANRLSYRAWALVFSFVGSVVLLVCFTRPYSHSSINPAPVPHPTPAPPTSTTEKHYYVYQTSEPPLYDDATDTDSTPPRMMLPPSTPSRQRSPRKLTRSASPVKLLRSPGKRGHI